MKNVYKIHYHGSWVSGIFPVEANEFLLIQSDDITGAIEQSDAVFKKMRYMVSHQINQIELLGQLQDPQ